MMISALNTCLVVHQRKAKVLREAGLKSKQSQHHYFSLLLHFTGIEKKRMIGKIIALKVLVRTTELSMSSNWATCFLLQTSSLAKNDSKGFS